MALSFNKVLNLRQVTILQLDQCDQTTRLCLQYFAIFNDAYLTKSIKIVPKWTENFAQNKINLKYTAKDF